MLKLFSAMNTDGIRRFFKGHLPIHFAARCSSLEILTFLHKAYPDSIFMLATNCESNLLHLALDDTVFSSKAKIAKLQYLCDQCPQLIHMKNSEGKTALHHTLQCHDELDLEAVKTLCKADETAVRDRCSPSDIDDDDFDCLPLHLLIQDRPLVSEVSDEADCFRLFLRLYPSSAGMKNGQSKSPYVLAVNNNLKQYFIRLLLANDPTINPVRRKYLNFEARREGMFLAFVALSTTLEPTIWAKLRYENVELLARVISYL